MAKLDFNPDIAGLPNLYAYSEAQKQLNKEKTSKTASTKRKSFGSVFKTTKEMSEIQNIESADAPSEADIPQLLDDIHSLGDALRDRTSPENLLKYKNAIKKFLHFIVEHGYTTNETWVKKSIFEKKKLTIVRLVNQKLENLATGILSGQKKGLEILANIEEINGLLVDLLH